MKKIWIFLLTSIISFTSTACGSENNVNPVQSFGNQINQQFAIKEFTKNGDWIYAIDELSSEKGNIVRFSLDNPMKQEIVYKAGGEPEYISVLDDWVYFVIREGSIGGNLYKIKKDGSKKTKLLNNVDFYILTEKAIYYDAKTGGVYAMSLDGSHKRKVLGKRYSLIGIDNKWISFIKGDEEESSGPYLKKLYGIGSEILIDPDLDCSAPFAVENNQIFFYRSYDDFETFSLIKKAINGKEIILTSVPCTNFGTLNKEGDWMFFSVGEKVYKVNVSGKSSKELFYQASDEVTSILLYNGDVLLSTVSGGGTYIKRDGTVIKL